MEHHLLVEHGCAGDRLEVLEGPTGRRSWSDEAKARIVVESFLPGIRVADVARRHGLKPQHLSTWRRLARNGKLTLPVDDEQVFAALALEESPLPAASAPAPSSPISSVPLLSPPVSSAQTTSAAMEIIVSGVTVRLPWDSSVMRISEIAAALRALT